MSSLLTKLGLKKEPPGPLPGSAQAQVDETQRLLESGDITETEANLRKYLATEGEAVIATELPEMPASIKPFLLFQSYAFLTEFFTFLVAVILSVKYFVSGCFFVGGSMVGLAASLGYLSIPQLVIPFSSIARWFAVSNHSVHMTGVISALGLFVYLTYFSWFNSCQSSVSKLSKMYLMTSAASLGLFSVACYRNEKGNGGYIRWLFKLFL